MATRDWDPATYERFKQERAQPFYDLLEMVERKPHMRVVDLGCGPGAMTAVLHDRLKPALTIGLDNSSAMLEKAAGFASETLQFEHSGIEEFNGTEEYDLVFSNAAIQWTRDHKELLARIWWALKPGGQLAIQIPDNGSHPSQTVGQEVAAELGIAHRDFLVVHRPEEYATWLYELGFENVDVHLQIYLHQLPSVDELIEWVKSSYLLGFKSQLSEEGFAAFMERYQECLAAELGDPHPYLLTFRRILMHARKLH